MKAKIAFGSVNEMIYSERHWLLRVTARLLSRGALRLRCHGNSVRRCKQGNQYLQLNNLFLDSFHTEVCQKR